jgi:hypothetical protein
MVDGEEEDGEDQEAALNEVDDDDGEAVPRDTTGNLNAAV